MKEPVPGSRIAVWLDSLFQDLQYAARLLLKSPSFTLAVVLSVALGVGANTAVFTLVNTLLLQPLSVADPATLVVVYGSEKGKASGATQISRPNFSDLRERATSFTELTATAGPIPLNLSRGSLSTGVFLEFAAAGYFDVLGLRPTLGRFFTADEDRTPGIHPVAVLSWGTWQRRFGGDPTLIGQTVRIAGLPVTVIGIAPKGFKGLSNFFGPELWVPSMMAESLLGEQGRAWLQERETEAFSVTGRLRPGVTREQAETELRKLANDLEQLYPAINGNRTFTVRPITEASLFPGLRNGLVAGSAFLMAAVLLVLVIACSNVANLLLARAGARRHEIAVRLAIGASRARVIRQLLTESLMLALMGGALGVASAAVVKRLLWAQRPAVVAESLVEPQLDGTVLIYSLVASLAAGVLFGLAPALQASSPEMAGALKEDGKGAAGRRGLPLANALVAVQVCFALLCLVVAGLCLRTVQTLYSSDPGFETRRLAILSASPGEAGFSEAQCAQYFREARARMEILPGVIHVSWASNPLLFGGPSRGIEIPGLPAASQAGRVKTSLVNSVEPSYFRTIGLPLLGGREFGPEDTARTLPVAIVNDAFAADYWPGAAAVGRRFRFSRETTERVIIGVAKTAALNFLGEPPQPCVYLPAAQAPQRSMVLYIRTAADPKPVLGLAQRTLRDVDPQVPPSDPTTVRELMDNNLWIARVLVWLLTVLGLLGLALASLGLYGVMAYSVGGRRREIGVRMALGATTGRIMRMVLRQGLSVVAAGAAVGLALGLLAGHALSAAFSVVPPVDLASFSGACAILLAAAALACWIPGRRASRVDPATALRQS